jgi:hypothetical protein
MKSRHGSSARGAVAALSRGSAGRSTPGGGSPRRTMVATVLEEPQVPLDV